MENIANKCKKYNKATLILFIIIVCILGIIIITNMGRKNKDKLPSQLASLEDILEYYNCKLINKVSSETEGLDYDVYLNFAKPYFTENKSNKAYFVGIITYLSKNLDYSNYALIDSAQQINIIVLCNKDEEEITQIYYNGERTYFEEKQNEQIINNYKEKKVTHLDINSDELKKIINNNWKNKKLNLGTQESSFDEYDIFFDEGIEIKSTATYIYNIIFTDKYKNSIVNGLKVNEKQEKIKSTLGEPAFINENMGIVGYKGEDIYIFFSDNEVSVYRVEKNYRNKEFLDLVNKLLVEKEASSFLNELTDIWNDYDLYIASDGETFIRYTLKGVEVSFNSTGGKITFYENFTGELAQGVTLKNLNNKNIPNYAKLDITTDLVWQQEKHRRDLKHCYYNKDYLDMPSVSGYEEENRNIGQKDSELFLLFSLTDQNGAYNIKFISTDRRYPNSELKPNLVVNYYGWLNNCEFIYSVKKKGIYMYDATKRITTTLKEGKEEFKIEKIDSNTIYYDNGKKVSIKEN